MFIKSEISILLIAFLRLISCCIISSLMMGLGSESCHKRKTLVLASYLCIAFITDAFVFLFAVTVLFLCVLYKKRDIRSLISFFIVCGGEYLYEYLYKNIQIILEYGPQFTLSDRIDSLGFDPGILPSLSTFVTIAILSGAWKRYKKSNGRYSNYLVIPLVSSEILIIIWMKVTTFLVDKKYLDSTSKSGYLFIFLIALILLSASIIAGVVFLDRRMYMEIADENRALLKSQLQHYSYLEKSEEEARKFRHDIKNHLYCLKHLLNKNDLNSSKEYLDQITYHYSQMQRRFNSGNNIIDAILEETFVSAEKEGIAMSVQGALPEHLEISSYDLCTIAANLLSNAVEGSCGSFGQKYIKIALGFYNSYIHLNVINSVSQKKNWSITGKADKPNHGYGLLNVNEAVARNNGVLDISCTDHEFQVDVLIPSACQTPHE